MRKTRTIRHSVWIRAPPTDVYDALMTSKGHSAFTGASARISPRVGGKFTAHDGYIHGRNVELVRGRKIVQEWRPAEDAWPKDHYSTVTFTLRPSRGGTQLTFLQTGVLPEYAAELAGGWKEFYWTPLKQYLE
ncbi:MAG TPA: SRPBCC family protein [Thermoplasmata archaeon]|nr:SRPBCC family protein [Thermoplasmata archaeon]